MKDNTNEVNAYADLLLKRNPEKLLDGQTRRPAGRPKGWKRTGSVLSGKKQTIWEAKKTSTVSIFYHKRWATLFAKPLNKWHLTT